MKWFISLSLIFTCMFAEAQEDIHYQLPSAEILELADAPMPPVFRMNTDGKRGIMLYRKSYKSIEELSETEMRLAGLRINPKTNISSRQRYYYDMRYFDVKSGEESVLTGLPENARLSNFSWSYDETKIAFNNTTSEGVELWVLDMGSKRIKQLTEATLNANMGRPMSWFKDNQALLVKMVSNKRSALIDSKSTVPTGPTVSVNEGKKAQNRTYQDLLKNNNDEFNFEQLSRAELWKIDLNGEKSLWKEEDLYRGYTFSPDGKYVMISTIERPFSYLVPYQRFPFKSNLYKVDGSFVKTILEVPLTEDLPKGFMSTRTGPRNMSWRSDRPATLYWVEAQDGGDPENEVDYRDVVYELNAPFNGEKRLLIQTKNRFYDVEWGTDNLAIAHDYWWNDRNTKTYIFDPSDNEKEVKVLYDRNYQDRYNDPGDFVTEENEFERDVLVVDDNSLYLLGDGYSDEGVRPFVDKLDLNTMETERLYRANAEKTLESISYALDIRKGVVLSRIESKNDYPNYYFRNVRTGTLDAVTEFENPFKAIQEVEKQLITYKREDGLELSATLYLPVGYDKDSGKKLPMLMWAYPREFKDKSSAGQVTSSPNEFTFPWYGSPIFWVTRGYAVLDDAAFPIVGEGEDEPNDSFRSQLVANAKAAIDVVDEMGYIDRNRVGVGGHSYGAFMTANLLSHSNLFAAGIARSGAYNRTLTPFGFQSEERNYWEAPHVYYEMSPFMHADKMKTPLLLVHGEADNNSGTYPMQSERYFNALKGLGATVRLVMLPKESHGYAARESVLHMLWEQDQWLDKYVKNKKVETAQP